MMMKTMMAVRRGAFSGLSIGGASRVPGVPLTGASSSTLIGSTLTKHQQHQASSSAFQSLLLHQHPPPQQQQQQQQEDMPLLAKLDQNQWNQHHNQHQHQHHQNPRNFQQSGFILAAGSAATIAGIVASASLDDSEDEEDESDDDTRMPKQVKKTKSTPNKKKTAGSQKQQKGEQEEAEEGRAHENAELFIRKLKVAIAEFLNSGELDKCVQASRALIGLYEHLNPNYDNPNYNNDMIDILRVLNVALLKLGRLEEAQKTAASTVKISKMLFGNSHKNTAMALAVLGEVYLVQQNFKKARTSFLSASRIINVLSHQPGGPKDQNSAINSSELSANIGQCFLHEKQYHKAIKWLQRALVSRREALRGAMDERSILLLCSLGQAMHHDQNVAGTETMLSTCVTLLNGIINAIEQQTPDSVEKTQTLIGLTSHLGLNMDYAARVFHSQRRYLEAFEGFDNGTAMLARASLVSMEHLIESWELMRHSAEVTDPTLSERIHTTFNLPSQKPTYFTGASTPGKSPSNGGVLEADRVVDHLGTLEFLSHYFDIRGELTNAEAFYKRCGLLANAQLGKEHPLTRQYIDKYSDFLRRHNRSQEASEIDQYFLEPTRDS